MPTKTILELTKDIEQYQVQGSIGAGDTIQYLYKDGTVIPAINAFVEAVKQDEVKSQGLISTRMFYSVELPSMPSYKDIIIYNGQNYLVEQSVNDDNYSNLYDIKTTLNKVPKGHKYGY